MADSPGGGGGTGPDSGSSVTTADAPTRPSADQPSLTIEPNDAQDQRGDDTRPPGRPLESNSLRKLDTPEPARPITPDLGRKSDQTPKSVSDGTTHPQDWGEDEEIELHADQPPDSVTPVAESTASESPQADAARNGVAEAISAGERQETAREAVDAAYAQAEADGVPPNTIEQVEARAQQAIDDAPSDTGAKEVEFKEPGPPKEVEFKEPTAAASRDAGPVEHGDAPQQAELPREVHSPEEQRVVDDAKAGLVSHERAGEVLGGDPVSRADQWHPQGQNDLHYENDCALAATSAVLRDCGVEASESDVVDQAVSAELCDTRHTNPADNGGVQDGRAISELLTQNGVENRIENPQDTEELAEYVEQGLGVITEIDAATLWDQPLDEQAFEAKNEYPYFDADGRSQVNHAVQVTGTVRDSSGELTGIVINDTGSRDNTGSPDGAGRVVPIEMWDACWSNTTGGDSSDPRDHETIVTNRPTSIERARR